MRFWFLGMYFLRAAARGLRSSLVTTAVSIVTIGIALVLVGGFLVITTNMRTLLERAEAGLALTAYLEDDADLAAIAAQVDDLEGVASVEAVSKQDAIERLRSRPGSAALLEGIEGNPLPASLVVRFTDPAFLEHLAARIEALPGVQEIGTGQRWMASYARALELVRIFGLGLGAVLAFATLLIVANTIRLAVYARRDELEILALVGASRSFRRVPFLLEGIAQGTAGGALALAMVYAIHRLVVPHFRPALELFLGWGEPLFLEPAQMALLIAHGAALGLLGAASALFWERLP